MLAGLALVLHRKWICLAVLVGPLLAWDVAGWLLTHRAGSWYSWLFHAWPWSEQSLYGRGSIFTFVAAMPLIVSPLVGMLYAVLAQSPVLGDLSLQALQAHKPLYTVLRT